MKVGSNGLIVVAWVAHPSGQPTYIGYAFSMDKRDTFAPPGQVTAPGGRRADHPTLVVTAENDVVLSWLGLAEDANQNSTDTHVYVSRVASGQTSFGPPLEVTANAHGFVYDRPRLGITSKGTLIDVCERTGPGEAVIAAARSTDGQTWTQSDLPLNDYFAKVGRRPSPCILAQGSPGGRFAVAHLGETVGKSSFGVDLLYSDDDGINWNDDVDYADAASVSGPRCVTSGNKYWLAYGFGSDIVGEEEKLLPMEDTEIVVRSNATSEMHARGAHVVPAHAGVSRRRASIGTSSRCCPRARAPSGTTRTRTVQSPFATRCPRAREDSRRPGARRWPSRPGAS